MTLVHTFLLSDSASFLHKRYSDATQNYGKDSHFLQFQIRQGKFPKVLRENANDVFEAIFTTVAEVCLPKNRVTTLPTS